MPARSKFRADARAAALVAPDVVRAPGRSDRAMQIEHALAAGALIVAFAIVTLFIFRALLAG